MTVSVSGSETPPDLCWLDVVQARESLRRGACSSVDLVSAHLERIAAVDPRVEAYVTVVAEDALGRAFKLDAERAAGRERGPLHGIPFSVKDVFATRGIRTTAGSTILADWVPEEDATVVRRLLDAGAVLLGKANTHEFAYGVTTRNVHRSTANPWDRTRIAGGSSGGSATAVAAGLSPFSVGTDTAGSIRLPAALTGVAGFKPSHGRVSCAGVVAQSFSADHAGPLARSVADLALVLTVIAGPDDRDPRTRNEDVPDYCRALEARASNLRIGIPRELFELGTEPDVAAAFAEAQRVFRGLGCSVREVSIPILAEASDLNRAVVMAETTARHDEWAEGWFAGRELVYGADVRRLLEEGREIPAPLFIRANHRREALKTEIDAALQSEVDLLLTPTVPFTAPTPDTSAVELSHGPVELLTASIHFLSAFSLTGFPALALPAGFAGNGLPVSIQLVSRTSGEPTALCAGHAFQQATDWHRRHPPL